MSSIKKSPNDNKQYRAIRLTNQLRVLLISDSEIEKSAASLVVNVGHFDDPVDIQGMAHLLEHMLFLGTESYPEPDAYQKFISGHGGSHNAWTGTEHTNFFFDIDHRFFSQALARFSQFFSAPLLAEEYVDKERQAIDAEFRVKLNDDVRRLYDVHKETVNPDHPFCKFSVGNNETLGKLPAATLRQALLDFYSRHYSADLMTLAIVDKNSLDHSEAIVRQHFSTIPVRDIATKKITTPLYKQAHLQHEIFFKPIKSGRKFVLSFAMPGIESVYRRKPVNFISMLLGHEGHGSLTAVLKKHNLITGLSAGGGISASNFKDYNISLQLTETGMEQRDKIVAMVLSYIQLVKTQGYAMWRYDEKVALAKLSFQFQEKARGVDNVNHLAMNMQHYPEPDYIYGDFAMDGISEAEFDFYCQFLSASNMRLVHIDENAQTNRTSQWYNAPYAFSAISDERIDKWKQQLDITEFALPGPNPYIVTEIQAQTLEMAKAHPTVVYKRQGLAVWHQQDHKFRVPKGHIYVAFDCPNAVTDAQAIASTRLYVELFLDAVSEHHYPAEIAGLSYHLYSHQSGLSLHVSGLSSQQSLLVKHLIDDLRDWQCDQARFELRKNQLLKNLESTTKNKSISQLFSKLGELIQPNSPLGKNLAASLSSLSFAQFQQFKQRIFERVKVDALVYGDWKESQAQDIGAIIEQGFFDHQQPIVDVKRPIALLPDNTNIIRELVIPYHDPAIAIYYQAKDKSVREMALFSLCNHIIAPQFFHELRTQRQFGYIVGNGYVPFNQYPGMAFYIQSPSVSPFDMYAAIDDFITRFSQSLPSMQENMWQQQINGLVGQWQEKDANLRVRSQKFWSAIANDDENFDMRERVVTEITNLTINDIVQFMRDRLVSESNPARLTVYSVRDKVDESHRIQGHYIDNKDAFWQLAKIVQN